MDWKVVKKCLGLIVEIVSMLCNASSAILFKTLKGGVSAEYFALYVYILQMSIFLPYAICRTSKIDYTGKLYKERYFHLGRGVFGSASFLLIIHSVLLIPLSDFFAIAKMTPCFVAVLAYFLLKEKFGLLQLVLLVLTSCGVVLYCKPSFLFGSSDSAGSFSLGHVYAICAACIHGMTYICQKKMRETPVPVSVLTNAVIGVLILVIPAASRSSWSQVECTAFPVMLASNVMAMAGLLLRYISSRLEDAGRLAMVTVVDLPFTMAVEIIFYGTRHSWTSYAGAAVIIVAVLALFVVKNLETTVSDPNCNRQERNSEGETYGAPSTNLITETSC